MHNETGPPAGSASVEPAEPTEVLAQFASDLSFDRLPDAAAHRVRQIAIDALASAVAGRHADEVAQLERAAVCMGTGNSTIIGGGLASQAGACLINGYMTTAVTVCDIHRPTFCHVSPEVVPPALAVAEALHRPGSEFLAGVAAGLEATVRIGAGLDYATFRARGWHSPGVSGTIGAAAAAGRVLGLDASEMANAFGLASAQAAGTFATYRTPTMKFTQGRAAMSGLLSATVAQQGFRAPTDALTHPDGGLLGTYSDGGYPEAITEQLGRRWDLEQIALKRWPVASSILSMATALFDIVEANDIESRAVARITLELPVVAYEMHGNMPWNSELQAHLSAPYIAAVILADRRCWLEQFSDQRRADPDLGAFARDRVIVQRADDLPADSAIVHLSTTLGPVISLRRDSWRGAPSDPLTGDELKSKFRDAAVGLFPEETLGQLWGDLSTLEEVDDMARIASLLRAPAS